MLDLAHYVTKHLASDDAEKILKYFGKKNFKSLNSLIYCMENPDLDWISYDDLKRELEALCSSFAMSLAEERLKIEDILSLIKKNFSLLGHPDFTSLGFAEGKYTKGICPCCGAKELYIPKHGKAMTLVCNRKNACAYSQSAFNYLKQYQNKSGKEALEIMAECAGTTLEEINYQNEVHTGDVMEFKKPAKKSEYQKVVEKEIEYMKFDAFKKYVSVDYEKFLPKNTTRWEKMDEAQRFKVLATAIYEFSKETKQWGKYKYYNSIKVTTKNPLLKEKTAMIREKLGYLFKTNIKDLINHLINDCGFSKEMLIHYGLIYENGRFYTDIQEGLVVIPNFDLYTNMVSGLKFRKTKLKEWTDKESGEKKIDGNKEPEFSFGRIANPLPYLLTREALLSPETRFRFFEGQKDLHSMPYRSGFCDIAIPGVNGISAEALGLFKGRVVELYFDQDSAGQDGALKLKEALEKAGAIVLNKTWDLYYGGDVNEVLKDGYIERIM